MVHLLWKSVWQFLKYLNARLPHDPAILLQGIYSKELKTGLKQILVHQCNVHCSIIHNREKLEIIQCPSTQSITYNMWNIHAVECYQP